MKDMQTPAEGDIPALAARGAALQHEIEERQRELSGIAEALEAWALAHPERHEPLEDARREGRQVRLPGATVRIESDLLIASFEREGARHHELSRVLGEPAKLKLFFDPPRMWTRTISDGAKFRARVAEELAPSTAAAFLAACRQVDKHGIPRSRVVVEFNP